MWFHTVARFIPTHVGNANSIATGDPSEPVHPHARGERPDEETTDHLCCGSSPRTWGTPKARTLRHRWTAVHPHARGERALEPAVASVMARFIPTHVGNARELFETGERKPVHPHARGERVVSKRDKQFLDRFIPTHVGNAAMRPMASATSPVHPHARGERHSPTSTIAIADGSSPRTWGTPCCATR